MARAKDKTLDELRARIVGLEGYGHRTARPRLSLGPVEIDDVLGGGLDTGCVHEVLGTAADGFAIALLSRLGGDAIWLLDSRTAAQPYPPGLAALGLDPARVVFVGCRAAADVLWGAEESLSSGAAGAVVAELSASVDLTASRRLQLAAEKGGAIGFVLPSFGKGHMAPNALTTRWRVTPVPSDGQRARWQLNLERQRVGRTGQWKVDWHDETHHFSLVDDPIDGSLGS